MQTLPSIEDVAICIEFHGVAGNGGLFCPFEGVEGAEEGAAAVGFRHSLSLAVRVTASGLAVGKGSG